MGSHFGVGEFTTHFRTYSSGDWDTGGTIWVLTHTLSNPGEESSGQPASAKLGASLRIPAMAPPGGSIPALNLPS